LYKVFAFEHVRAHGKAGGTNSSDIVWSDVEDWLQLIDPEDWGQ
jgi:hypothetical protein